MTLLATARSRLPYMLEDIRELVRCESPSSDLDALAACAELVDTLGARQCGSSAERVVCGEGTHLRWRLGSGPRTVLLLGHFDTVWPIGSVATHPWSTDGGIMRGPGCFDMKCGVAQIFHAVGMLRETGGDAVVDGVTILLTSDEELGSPTSRELIEAEAREHRACFVTEASAPGGALKLARKGVSLYTIRTIGRSAHAGLEPEAGVNSAVELAHQILAIAGLGDAGAGTTVTPTVVSAGTTMNTVPGEARVAVDVRVATLDEQERVDVALRALNAVLPEARLAVEGGPNRPPMEAGSSADLFRLGQELAHRLGLGDSTGVAVGGASDGNFTAGVGTATLDGMGAVGGGAHADDEHVVIAEIPSRTALLAAMIRAVSTPGEAHAD